MELDDEILELIGDRQDNDSEQEQGQYSDSEVSDPEWEQVKTWDQKTLMGDEQDRKRLMKMSELEREMVLAERQKKLEAVKDRMIMKRKLSSKLNAQPSVRETKQQRLEDLRNNRAKRESDRRSRKDSGTKTKKRREYSSQSESESEPEEVIPVTFEDIKTLVITGDELENWCHRDNFDSTVKGAFVRLSVGKSGDQRIYRLCQIVEVVEYHRTYRFGGTVTNKALSVSHGKAKKVFLMDIVSKSPITEQEWQRYEKTVKAEKEQMITIEQVKRRRKVLEQERERVATHEEIEERIKIKREFIKVPTNLAQERLRLADDIKIAQEQEDFEEVEKLKEKLKEIDELAIQIKNDGDERLQVLSQLNARNRKVNLAEGRQAEREAFEQRQNQGENEYDPFARRKTAPKHVVNFDVQDATKKAVSKRIEKRDRRSSSPERDAILSQDEDDFLENLDVQFLKEELV
ncbi:hypothetical protein EDD86DRAFT_196423, partial [Gorgonomyces haynaldii]